MSALGWYLLVGGILLSMGLMASQLRAMPITSAMFYLAVGVVIGPTFLHLFHFNPLQQSAWLEVISEVAVLISLYTCGLKLRLPPASAAWRVPLRLATLSMVVGIGLVALFAHLALGMSWGAAVLIGAILAPTDPVLATDVQVRHVGDHDRLRFGLTAEAGLNDGTAFPFVMLGLGLLGLHEIGTGIRWLWADVLWACAAGVTVGGLLGCGLAQLVFRLRRVRVETVYMDDFLGLGLIALTNGAALAVGGYAFLAVFAAAVALRQTERRLQYGGPAPERPGDEVVGLADGSLHFNEQLERIAEVVLILLLGGSLFVNSWTWEAVATAAFVFLVARPVGVYLGLWGARVKPRARHYMAWFGVRGIGSFYYLMFAIQHGLAEPLALQLLSITLIVVTLSILVHGVTVTPMMRRYTP